jgi:hypothetical protein
MLIFKGVRCSFESSTYWDQPRVLYSHAALLMFCLMMGFEALPLYALFLYCIARMNDNSVCDDSGGATVIQVGDADQGTVEVIVSGGIVEPPGSSAGPTVVPAIVEEDPRPVRVSLGGDDFSESDSLSDFEIFSMDSASDDGFDTENRALGPACACGPEYAALGPGDVAVSVGSD